MIAEILGRFHPLIVHLPIGILMLASIMEVMSRFDRFEHLKSSMGFVLQIAILTSVAAWFTGWIMPKEGSFEGDLVGWHFWMAGGMTLTTVLLYGALITNNARYKSMYTPLFVMTIVLLSLTGHYGGSLTHGEGHLTAPLTDDIPLGKSLDSMIVYTDIIVPIFKKKCYSCHNDNKQKGSLQLNTIAGILKGNDDGPILLASNASNSLMIKSFYLPIDDKKHMPPEGKKQLTNNEISLIEWWVDSGASFEDQVADTDRDEEIQDILSRYEQKGHSLNIAKIPEVSDEELQSMRAKGISVMRLSADNKLLSISFSRDTLLTKRKLKQLSSIESNIVELDLSHTNVEDDMLSVIDDFDHLLKLKLNNTQIGSNAIKHLLSLEHLRDLNLYDTNVDDECLESLKEIKGLQSVYIWQSDITAEAQRSFTEENPLIKMQSGVDPDLFGPAQLQPPILAVDKAIFTDTTSVTMSLNLQNIDIFYTTDGSMPDTTSSIYKDPIILSETTEIKALSYKEGWLTSEVASMVIFKKGYQIENIELSQPPSEKYPAQGVATLIDDKFGSISFGDKSFLGYQATDVSTIIDLGNTALTKSVIIGALEDINNYIFFPKGIEVSSSIDGKEYKDLTSVDIPVPSEAAPASYNSFLLEYEQHEAKYIKLDIQGLIHNPDWHVAPGAKNWLFVDEIVVN